MTSAQRLASKSRMPKLHTSDAVEYLLNLYACADREWMSDICAARASGGVQRMGIMPPADW